MDRMTEFEKLCSEYKDNKNLIKEIESMNDTIKAAIIAEMNGAEKMSVGAFTATNKPRNNPCFDKDSLKKDHPDIFNKYYSVKLSNPVFTVR